MSDIEKRVMSRSDAERLTERIRLTATTFMEAKERLTELIGEAQQGNAHEALGYRSWTEYVSQVFSDTPLMRLSRDERKELVGELASQGMSGRAIAPIVGASEATVRRDVQQSASFDADKPREIVSTDGITRTFQPKAEGNFWEPEENTEPPKPKRTPLPQSFLNAIVELRKATERIERLIEDDRFNRNKKEIAATYYSDLERASTSLSYALEAFNQ